MTADLAHFRREGERLTWRGDGETVVVEPWGRDSVRVRARLMHDVIDHDWALLPPSDTAAAIEIDGARATLTCGRLRVVATSRSGIQLQTGYDRNFCHLAFYDTDGRLLFQERDAGGSLALVAREHRPIPGGDVRLIASFDSATDEHLFGMGQYQQDVLDLKGCTFELAHRNSQSSVPFVMSSRGYGFFWHNPAIGRATFAANGTQWSAESTEQLDYWVTAGATPRDIARAYADATGHTPMMPERGLGFWQCKLRYSSQEELLAVAREHVRRGLPLDVIVADFFHWPRMGDFRFEEEFWPDPAEMVRELDGLGVELMVSVWPQVALDSENYAVMKKENLLVRAERGLDVHMSFEGPSAFLDATNPRAREFVWQRCRENYARHGIRTFWLDEAEPEYGLYDYDNYRYHAGPVPQVGNLYPQHFARAFAEGQWADGESEVVNLLRTAWAGSQRYGALVWSGDIASSFAALRAQVTAGIHMGVAGIPWFTTDIGGFHQGDPDDEGFRELLVRWFQFGAFCPVMRLHGDRMPSTPVRAADGSRRSPSGGANEVWSFGDAATPVLERYLRTREALRPYLRTVMREAHVDGQPVLRGQFHDFPDDARSWRVRDQFLLGSDLLVAPVMEAGARSRRVVLPSGVDWRDLWTGVRTSGGGEIEVDAPIDRIPLFVREDTADAWGGVRRTLGALRP
ncbi:TIM-barrel domain-containing protein [Microbacterium sp. lyk4-40-TSB-66]|uniref:glycoside hydrolase family 31 protein n=1 Tax=Microbacterium sp. lyk4-40-TSB-66 TaxID=3040294 RepID=UPI00254AD952|nr:TIM-barrel domain-containing protein [Microbacterium sp. lyk4-40-TSB-66]